MISSFFNPQTDKREKETIFKGKKCASAMLPYFEKPETSQVEIEDD